MSPQSTPPRATGAENDSKAPAPEEKEDRPTPLKAAADLIHSLDVAYVEMTACAADAARDAEEARRNARAASEIARRYLNRSYPKVQSSFGGTPTHSSPNFKKWDGEAKFDISQELNGIGTDNIPGTPQMKVRPHHQDFDDSKYLNSSGRKRKNIRTPTSAERIAQAHADDVLTLSLDLERCKQALKSEQQMHEETKATLAAVKAKNESLEQQTQKMLNDFETQREESGRKIDSLEQELGKSRMRAEAAEEDANLALELAKDAAEKRDEVEMWLQKCLQELQTLKEKQPQNVDDSLSRGETIPTTPKRTVRFADHPETPILSTQETPPVVAPEDIRSGPSRSMVAAGRILLRRSKATSDEQTVCVLELTPSKSAERRQRLRESLRNLDADAFIPTPPRPSLSPRTDSPFANSGKSLDECKNVAKILQETGQRLDLGGHWWRDPGKAVTPEVHLDVMTRQFCQSVEVS